MTAVRLSLAAAVVFTSTARPAEPPVTALAYSPDGGLLAAGTHGRVVLIDPKTGDDVRSIGGIPGRVTALTFSRNDLLAVASGEPGRAGVVRLYDPQTGRMVAEFAAHKDAVYSVAFRPGDKEFATAGYDRVIKVWPVGGTVPRLTLTDHSDAVYAVAYSPDGTLLASGSADRAVKVWDAATGKRLYTLGDPTDWVYAVAWHPDGKTLAAGGVDKSVRLWEATPTGGRLLRSAFAHEGAVTRLAFGPDGKSLVSAGEDRVVKMWDAAKLVEARVLPKFPDAVLSLDLRPDGKQLAVGRFDGAAGVFDPATGKAGPAVLSVKPKPPAITSVIPPSIHRGTTVWVTFSGSRLDEVTKVTASDPAATVKLQPADGPDRRNVALTLLPSATVGPIQLILTSAAGTSAPVRFVIDRYPGVPESGATDSAHTAMPVTLPATVVGTVDRAGDTDYFGFDAKAGRQLGAQVVTLGSKLDPVLVLVDAQGQVLAEGTGVLGHVIPTAGRYAVGVRDREYRGGKDLTYRLHLGDVPVVTSVFPLAVQRGKAASVHLDGVNLGPAHAVTVRVPADAAVGSRVAVPLSPTAAGDRPLGDASVAVAEFPSVVAADTGTELRSLPMTADGILASPGQSQAVRFPAKAGQRLVIETHAARLGSPLDPTVEVLDAAGHPVPRATLRCIAKTFLTFRDHPDDKPGLRLDAWNELAANDYIYAGTELMRIKALPGHPDADCDFVQIGGKRVSFLDTTPTHHALNTPMYKVEVHPPGAAFPPNGMPVFTLYHRNDDGGPGYGKDARLFFDPPADGVYQVRVADARGAGGPAFAYRLTVRPPRPDFALSVKPDAPAVWRGGTVPLTVTATRIDGFAGRIDVRLDGLPTGFAATPTYVEEEQVVATIAMSADTDAAAATDKLRLIGRAVIDGKEVVREVAIGTPKAIAGGDIVTSTDAAGIAVHPGRETRFVAAIERRNGFAGRVPLEVRGLPHGVTVQNIGLNGIMITEKDTRREIVLRAEPWVKPTAVPVVVVATHERKKTEHAAKAVVLKVE